jgi:dihydrolipoamide dehydrogenase
VKLPGAPDDPRIIDSTGALELDLPAAARDRRRHHRARDGACTSALGVEGQRRRADARLMPGCDRDLVKPLEKRIAKRYEAIMLARRSSGSSR